MRLAKERLQGGIKDFYFSFFLLKYTEESWRWLNELERKNKK
jgi:hypothetical protein